MNPSSLDFESKLPTFDQMLRNRQLVKKPSQTTCNQGVKSSNELWSIDLFSLFEKPPVLRPQNGRGVSCPNMIPKPSNSDQYWRTIERSGLQYENRKSTITFEEPMPQSVLILNNPIILETVNVADIYNLANEFCMWEATKTNLPALNQTSMKLNQQNVSSATVSSKPHLENLEEVKLAFGSKNPYMTKDQMYDELLKPYKCQKIVQRESFSDKEKIYYVCKYENCNKRFTKTWNLLDHVRMHEGIRPYKWMHCPKSFTQKGNLKKHQIQHTISTLKDRKRFKCDIWGKGYTEKYNLEVSIIHY